MAKSLLSLGFSRFFVRLPLDYFDVTIHDRAPSGVLQTVWSRPVFMPRREASFFPGFAPSPRVVRVHEALRRDERSVSTEWVGRRRCPFRGGMTWSRQLERGSAHFVRARNWTLQVPSPVRSVSARPPGSAPSPESGLDLYEDSSVWGLLGEIPECRHHRLRPDEIGLEQKK
jgi:hypothetical protein